MARTVGAQRRRSRLRLRPRLRWEVLTVPTKRLTITPFQISHVIRCGTATLYPDVEAIERLFLTGFPDDFLALPFLTHPRFVHALLWLQRGQGPQVDHEDLGVYAPILAAWHDVDGLAAALRATLDWHVARTRASGKGDLAEFEDLIMFAFPAEVLAVLRVRERLSLPLPAIDHPLLDHALGRCPPDRPWPTDPLLRRCEAVLHAM